MAGGSFSGRPPGPTSATVTVAETSSSASRSTSCLSTMRAPVVSLRRRADGQHVVDGGGPEEIDRHVPHREGAALRRQLVVVDADEAEIVGAAALHELQIARVIDAAGKIRVLEIDALRQDVRPVYDAARELVRRHPQLMVVIRFAP